jgi:hypothetical protein
MSFTSLVNYINSYTVIFAATVSGIAFMISFSKDSLLVYRKTMILVDFVFCYFTNFLYQV